MRQITRLATVTGLVAVLAGCDPSGQQEAVQAPPVSEPIESVTRSQESLELESYYGRVEQGLLQRGLLRRDYAAPDAPYGADDLARNFEQIVFFDEFSEQDGTLIKQESSAVLRRWENPVKLEVVFGPSVTLEMRAKDGNAISEYASRLSRVSGHPIRQVSKDGNFLVYIQHEDDRRQMEQVLRDFMPGISDATLAKTVEMSRETYCLVLTSASERSSQNTRAIAVIRAELPDLLRLSCIHEELAQGLGLTNDSPRARPSIFNDDDEFALLTGQDEKLLSMLFDTRLSAGMSAQTAAPIITEIAAELMAGGST